MLSLLLLSDQFIKGNILKGLKKYNYVKDQRGKVIYTPTVLLPHDCCLPSMMGSHGFLIPKQNRNHGDLGVVLKL